MEVGSKVVMKKKHRKKHYMLKNVFEYHSRFGELKDLESFEDAVNEFIACAGVGEVVRLGDDPYVTFRNTFEGIVYEYSAYFEKEGLKVLK